MVHSVPIACCIAHKVTRTQPQTLQAEAIKSVPVVSIFIPATCGITFVPVTVTDFKLS